MVVNRIRLLIATVLVMLSNLALTGSLLSFNAGADRWMWLSLSGIAGLVIGDGCLFQAYVLIGARLSVLMMAASPVISAFLAWYFLGEIPRLLPAIGIVVTVLGILLVVSEQQTIRQSAIPRKQYIAGLLFGLGGAAGQASNLILAKKAFYGGFPTISGVTIRMFVSAVIIWLLAAATGKVRSTIKLATSDRKALGHTVLGSIVGPFIGIWLSIYSIQTTLIGVASTLQSLMPIMVLPISKWAFKEHISSRAVIGTLVAIVGVAMIFLF